MIGSDLKQESHDIGTEALTNHEQPRSNGLQTRVVKADTIDAAKSGRTCNG